MEVVLHVSRNEDGRLMGSVRTGTESSPREFSGVLELLRVFEELVPSVPVAFAPDGVEQPTTEGAE